MSDALREYQDAERKLDAAINVMMETMHDAKATRAARTLVEFYRARRNEAFEAWRATWAPIGT